MVQNFKKNPKKITKSEKIIKNGPKIGRNKKKDRTKTTRSNYSFETFLKGRATREKRKC